MKKILLVILISINIFGITLDNIAPDYPYKDDPVQATVLSTPRKDFYKFENPKLPKIEELSTTRKEIPNVLETWGSFKYGYWEQKDKKAPLMFVISGTGSTYNSALSLYLSNLYYEAGYHVVSVSSTTTLPFAISRLSNSYSGYIVNDSKDLYNVLIEIKQELENKGIETSHSVISGFSMGGYQSILVHELDTKEKKLDIRASIPLNTPISISKSSEILDSFLIENDIYEIEDLERYFDNIYKKIYFEKGGLSLTDISGLQNILDELDIQTKDYEVLIGILFRLYSANLTFVGDSFNNGGRLINKNEGTPKKYTSLEDYFEEGISITFKEYSKDILYKDLVEKNKYNKSYDEFLKDFSLENSVDFIKNNKNIIFITSYDDILIDDKDREFIKNNFANNIFIPYGGHTGILWHKDVGKLIIEEAKKVM